MFDEVAQGVARIERRIEYFRDEFDLAYSRIYFYLDSETSQN